MSDQDYDDEFVQLTNFEDGLNLYKLKPKYRLTDVVEYVWLTEKKENAWTVSDWNGERERVIDPRQISRASPDLDFGQPVIRWIGSGKLAQHMRLEYVQREIAA